jgi:hypothetical protein
MSHVECYVTSQNTAFLRAVSERHGDLNQPDAKHESAHLFIEITHLILMHMFQPEPSRAFPH